ncbi:hypothetical protein MRB53_021760 [Persea americana]|uniref:Uncharacterized protein n=1 Tax=Persea americana TaxID=3435 RepID=A0ACC2L5Y2_PERAE|nr:hypothetical protein MRB53_021760 [Persea americana]
MRIGKPKSIDREAAFNAYIKSMEDNSNDEEDEETANLVRKLKKGQGKYKGKLPFKCFTCGGVGHFAAKCPHRGMDNDEDEAPKKKKNFKWNVHDKKGKHRSFVSKKIETSSDDNNSSDSAEVGCEALFMVMFDEVKEPEISDKEEEEPEVNLEGELVAALEELTIETKKHKKTANKLKEAENLLLLPKGEMEEDKRIIEELEAQVVLKTEECSKLKEQVTIFHAQVDELSQKIKVYQGSSKLDNLLNMQRPCHIKLGLGYEHGETSTKPAEGKVKETQQKVVKQVPTQAHPQVKPYIHMVPSQRTWPRRQNFKPSRPLQQTYFRSKAYKCYNKRLQKIVESANVKINESVELPKDVKEIELPIYGNTSVGLEEQEEQPEQEKEVEANDNSDEMRQNDKWHKYHGIKETDIIGDPQAGCPLFVLSKGEKRTGQGGEVLSTIPKGEIVEQGLSLNSEIVAQLLLLSLLHRCYCFFFFITLLQLVFSVSCIVAASKLRHA